MVFTRTYRWCWFKYSKVEEKCFFTLICRWRWCTASYRSWSGSLLSRRSGCLSPQSVATKRHWSDTKVTLKWSIDKYGGKLTEEFWVRFKEAHIFEPSSVNHKGTQSRSRRNMALKTADKDGEERNISKTWHILDYLSYSKEINSIIKNVEVEKSVFFEYHLRIQKFIC